MVQRSNYEGVTAKIEEIVDGIEGATFGYIGNCGVNGSGPFDDRLWFVFLAHPGRVGTAADRLGGFLTGDAVGARQCLRVLLSFRRGVEHAQSMLMQRA